MKTLDLFKDFTPAMVEAVKYKRTDETRKRMSSSARERWDTMPQEEKQAYLESSFLSPEAMEKSHESNRKTWRNKTPEEIERYIRRTFLSPEAIEASIKARRGSRRLGGSFLGPMSASYLSLSRKESERGRIEKIRNFWSSPESQGARDRLSEAGQRTWASKTPEEKEDWLKRSCGSNWTEERRLKIAESNKVSWYSLSEEGRKTRGQKSLEGKIRSGNFGGGHGLTTPELFLGMTLENIFPKQWRYNGTGINKVNIGRRIPDFIHRNGQKAVIEVFGEYWHKEEEVDERIRHYGSFGYGCLVLWSLDCFCEGYIIDRVGKFLEIESISKPKGGDD